MPWNRFVSDLQKISASPTKCEIEAETENWTETETTADKNSSRCYLSSFFESLDEAFIELEPFP